MSVLGQMYGGSFISKIPVPTAEPVLLDVTRLIELRWTGRQPNGIDRVCLAYVRHFGRRARAVVQHRGIIRVLNETASLRLFDQLVDAGRTVRSKIAAQLAAALATPKGLLDRNLYLNVTHTDFDLGSHARWVIGRALRAVYLIHDLIPILHPEHCRPHAVTRHTGRVRAALEHGSGIVVGSAAVARDLHAYAATNGLRVPPVMVAALAGAPLRHDAAAHDRASDYFLCVGTIESRKNHDLLLKVWQRLRARLGEAAPRLIIVGRWGSGSAPFQRALDASGLNGNLIQVLDNCDDQSLAGLMARARAMLMPSLAEGFGLPLAEALTAGIPVIASNLPCFREVGQGIPCLLDPRNVDAWEERIIAFDAAAARRQRLIDALLGYRANSWSDHFGHVDPWLAGIAATPPQHQSRPDALALAIDAARGRRSGGARI